MADITPFSFRPGDSLLHRVDTRIKFFIISLISMSILQAGPVSSCFFFLILLFFFLKTKLRLFLMLWDMKFFLILLFFIFLARAVTITGDNIFSSFGFAIEKQGLMEGALVAFKFFLIMLTGILFSATTTPSSVKAAVQWFLKPFPFIPEKRVAVMISLALCFMPVILRQAKEISDAQKARCAHLRKNPIRKTMGLVLPLLKKTFLSADHLILAMESRCYNDDRTDPEFTPSGKERGFLLGGIMVCVGLMAF